MFWGHSVGWHFHTAHKWPRIFPFEDWPMSLGKTKAVSYWSIHHHRLKWKQICNVWRWRDTSTGWRWKEKRRPHESACEEMLRRSTRKMRPLTSWWRSRKVTIRPAWCKLEGMQWQSVTTAPGGPRRAQLKKIAPVLRDTCQSENKRKPLLVKLFLGGGASNYL